jgi:hypothetical protein
MIATYSSGRFSTFLFSLLSTVAFFGGGIVTLYVMATGQDEVITDLLTGNFNGHSDLTGLLGRVLVAGILCFLMALLSDFIRQVLHRKLRKPTELRLVIRLLTLIRLPANEQEYIVGDLTEEFLLFESRTKAYFWLLRQVIKSSSPLILKIIHSRLASIFGQRTL